MFNHFTKIFLSLFLLLCTLCLLFFTSCTTGVLNTTSSPDPSVNLENSLFPSDQQTISKESIPTFNETTWIADSSDFISESVVPSISPSPSSPAIGDSSEFPSSTVTPSDDPFVSPETPSELPSDDIIEGGKMPIIYIHTENGVSIPADKKQTVNCTVDLESSINRQNATGLVATIRCRGNGSLEVGERTGKYPYKLDFEKKINVFDTGEGRAKEWVLLANVGDQTMLRDYIAKLFGDRLAGIPYSANVRHVKVYLNDSYIGVYTLCEQIEVKECRINIDDTLTTEENGFLIELDDRSRTNHGDHEWFRAGGISYTVKSDIHSKEQLNFIKAYIQKVDDAINASDYQTLEQLVDISSLVDMYILQEYTKNIDVGYSSFYMYRNPGGKLQFAPWDFDLALGNDRRLDGGSSQGLYVATGRENFMQNSRWYIRLYQDEWFQNLVHARWAEVTETEIPWLMEQVRIISSEIHDDMVENFEHWDFLGKRQQQEPTAVYKLTTYQEHIDYLLLWMTNRKTYLDATFLGIDNSTE